LSTSIIVRKNVSNLTNAELKSLRTALGAMMKITDNRGYKKIAGFHGVPEWYCWHHDRNFRPDETGQAALFLPWHRAYLKWFEDHIRDHDSSVALCWWDWSSPLSHKEGIPKAYTVEKVDGSSNPLYKFHISEPSSGGAGSEPELGPIDEDTSRDPHPDFSELRRITKPPLRVTTALEQDEQDPALTREVGMELLSLEQFTDFSRALEDIHDFIHGWVGGTMSELSTAAFDPVFYAHHANIDRIWWMWQLQHGNSSIPSEWLDYTLPPFPYTVRQVLNISELGYSYATASTQMILGGE
jgi:tyrosinase